jgi:hypothetical protein
MASRRTSVGLLFTVVLAACDHSLGPDSVRSVAVEVNRTTLVEGESIGISVFATGIDGGTISGSEVTWISRDPTTVRVEDGSLFAVAPGVTRIIVDVRGARDSVRIRVRFGGLSQGEIGIRLQGEGGVRHATDGRTFMRRVLTLDGVPSFPPRTEITTSLGQTDVPSDSGIIPPIFVQPDTLVWITFGGDPTVGARQLPPFEVDTLDGTLIFRGSEGAMVRISDPENSFRTELFAPVDFVDLEIDEVIMPAEPGGQGGLLRGTVAFEAAGLIIEYDTTNQRVDIIGPASDETLRVYAEFVTDLFESLSGTAILSATTDGVTSSGFTGGAAFSINNGLEFHLSVVTPADDPDRKLIVLRTRLEATSDGSVAVGTLDADTFDPTMGPSGTWSYATIFSTAQGHLTEDDVTRYGYSTGGEIVLTEYRAATAKTYGLVRGTYGITYALRDRTNMPTGETMEATAEFLLPIRPICGFLPACDGQLVRP